MIILAVLSHGGDGTISGTDGEQVSILPTIKSNFFVFKCFAQLFSKEYWAKKC